MATGRPPAPVPQEPADPTARASLELPLLFQPHVDLEKTSGGGLSTEQTTSSSQVNGFSQSQDSEAAGFEAINGEEPFKGYSFEVCLARPPHLPSPLLAAPRGCPAACSQGCGPGTDQILCSISPDPGTNAGTAMLCLCK